MSAQRFRKKPVAIEAVQWTGKNYTEVYAFYDPDNEKPALVGSMGTLTIPTLEGEHIASPGDWIIKGVAGEFYPCKPDIFEATYEPASVGCQQGNGMSGEGVGYTLATGRLFCHIDEFHAFAERTLGRPIFTHEFADRALWTEMREAFEAGILESSLSASPASTSSDA